MRQQSAVRKKRGKSIVGLILLAVITLSAVIGFGCHREHPDFRYPRKPGADEQQVSDGMNRLAFKFYAHSKVDGHSMLISPYSLSLALSMLYRGAAGQTQKEIGAVLGSKLPESRHHKAMARLQCRIRDAVLAGQVPQKESKDQEQLSGREVLTVRPPWFTEPVKPSLTIQNSLICRERAASSIRQGYQKSLRKYYGASLIAEKDTESIHPRELKVSGMPSDEFSLILRNSLLLSLPWKHLFADVNTSSVEFYPENRSDDDGIRICMMMDQQGRFGYAERPGLQVLEMPYAQEDFCLRVLLPDSLSSFEKDFSYAKYQSIAAGIETREVQVYLPRFELESPTYNLIPILAGMGMRDSFDLSRADFSPIFKKGISTSIYVLRVSQESKIAIKEGGTVASSLTEIELGGGASDTTEKDGVKLFLANHPFIYMLVHKPTGSILFMGSYR